MQAELYSEEEILRGCQDKQRFFQELLYRKFSRTMYSICISYAGDRQLAQDVLHDAFIKIFNTIGSFNRQGSLEGWIRRIVTNTAIDQLRKNQRQFRFIENETDFTNLEQASGVNDEVEAKEIMKQVARLPEGARAIFNLFALEGFTHKEIAMRLNISEGTSKSQYNRARQLLMQWIEK